MRYKSTSKGTRLPERWGLPDELRDSTGVIFASVFPGYDAFADEAERYYTDRSLREQLATLEDLRARNGHDRRAGGRTGPAHRRPARGHRQIGVSPGPPLPVPRAFHGAFAIRGADRSARPQHAAECCVRQHHAGSGRGGRLDPHRPLPPRGGGFRRRHHVGPPDRMVRRGISGQRRGGHRRRDRGNRDSLRPASQRHDHRNGRGGAGHRKRRSRRRTRACARFAKC